MLQKHVGNLHWDAFLLGSMEMSGRLPSPKAVDWRSWCVFGCIHSEWVAIRSYMLSYIYILLFIYYHCLCTQKNLIWLWYVNIWYVDTWYVDIWYILYRYIILIDTYIYICGFYDYVGPKRKNTSNVAFLVGILNPSSVQRNEVYDAQRSSLTSSTAVGDDFHDRISNFQWYNDRWYSVSYCWKM